MKFSYHEIQFITIDGLDGQLAVSDVTGYRLTSLAARTGDFRCSSDLLNKMYNATVRPKTSQSQSLSACRISVSDR